MVERGIHSASDRFQTSPAVLLVLDSGREPIFYYPRYDFLSFTRSDSCIRCRLLKAVEVVSCGYVGFIILVIRQRACGFSLQFDDLGLAIVTP